MPRIAIGGIVHETNTFAPERTGLAAFAQQSLCEGDELLRRMRDTPTALGGALEGFARAGMQAVPLLYAAATPSGIVTHEAYETLLADLLSRLSAMLPVDGVLLILHGAMVADGQDDCEGDILQRVRAIVGPHCPLIATLDMHGNVSPAMVAAADALVAFDQNPHLDTFERGLEAAAIMQRMLAGGLHTTTALARPPLLLSALTTWTEQPPLRPVHERAQQWERDPHVVNVSVMGGFAYADTPYSGVSVIVTTDGEPALAQQIADELAGIAWAHRDAAAYTGLPVDEAVQRAMAASRGPVILADVGDNIGGGSPGDGTALLRALLDAGAQAAAVILTDPQAVERAVQAGTGADVEMLVGGKCDTWHGEPVWVRGRVERLTDGHYAVAGNDHFAQLYGREVNMGRCAVLSCGQAQGAVVRVVLNERKTPPGDLAQLRSQGITPEEQKIIVVKSAVAFRGAYQPIAAWIFEVDTPGLCAADLRRFTYHKMPRPIFPLDTVGA
ncbi:MAG: M81 family metallopeptidase [Chloroflexi bacterium]|nr:M81 family metallopeptidase [Chloroflexota bacterium]